MKKVYTVTISVKQKPSFKLYNKLMKGNNNVAVSSLSRLTVNTSVFKCYHKFSIEIYFP